jgi:hypothetical protein
MVGNGDKDHGNKGQGEKVMEMENTFHFFTLKKRKRKLRFFFCSHQILTRC